MTALGQRAAIALGCAVAFAPSGGHGCARPCGHEQAGCCRPGLPAPWGAAGRERSNACDLWHETGYVYTTPTGQPVNPSTDCHACKRLLTKAGVEERRLHDTRHTAATVLLLLGVPERPAELTAT